MPKTSFKRFLIRDEDLDAEYLLPPLDGILAKKLVERIDSMSIFMHAYSFHLNFSLGDLTPFDLLDFAKKHSLAGISININYGIYNGLIQMDEEAHKRFSKHACDLGLRINIETSSSTYDNLEQATQIARRVGAKLVRCYPRYTGRVSEIMTKTIEDLKQIKKIDPKGELYYVLEQHEDLKSHELVKIIKAVDNPRLSLLFDFGNMINAYEEPENALTIMEPYATTVHVKDIQIVKDGCGWAQIGCKSGTGDINMPLLMFRLLLLGDDKTQIREFALEEEVGYSSPAFRFPDEESDPFIPMRGPSETGLNKGEDIEERLADERLDVIEQITFIKNLLKEMRSFALDIT